MTAADPDAAAVTAALVAAADASLTTAVDWKVTVQSLTSVKAGDPSAFVVGVSVIMHVSVIVPSGLRRMISMRVWPRYLATHVFEVLTVLTVEVAPPEAAAPDAAALEAAAEEDAAPEAAALDPAALDAAALVAAADAAPESDAAAAPS